MTFTTFRKHLRIDKLIDAKCYYAPLDHVVKLDNIHIRVLIITEKHPKLVMTGIGGDDWKVGINRKRNWELYKMVKVV